MPIIITRVYDDYDSALAAKDAVIALGLPGVEVSLLGNEAILHQHTLQTSYDPLTGIATNEAADTDATVTTAGAGIGAAIGGGAGLLAGLGMLAIPGVGPIVAAGWLAATAVGAAGGAFAGGAVGALVDLGLAADDAPVFSEAMRRGHVAVSVRAAQGDQAAIEAALVSVPHHPLIKPHPGEEAESLYQQDTGATRAARITARRDIKTPDRTV
ncbi:hypothetical protein [Cypionkella aquatica]|nr:hypothetical protein [Cypionkella aquatica]